MRDIKYSPRYIPLPYELQNVILKINRTRRIIFNSKRITLQYLLANRKMFTHHSTTYEANKFYNDNYVTLFYRSYDVEQNSISMYYRQFGTGAYTYS